MSDFWNVLSIISDICGIASLIVSLIALSKVSAILNIHLSNQMDLSRKGERGHTISGNRGIKHSTITQVGGDYHGDAGQDH